MTAQNFLLYRAGERQGYLSPQEVDPLFRQQFVTALLHHQVDLTKVDAGKVDSLMQSMWQDPYFQSLWTNPDYTTSSGLPNLTTNLDAELFNNPQSAYFNTGIDLMSQSGAKLSATQIGARDAASTAIPTPWSSQFNVVSGNDYGQAVDPNSRSGGYGPIHLGVDYGTPAGTPISTPFAGTLHVETGIPDYGNLVYVTLADGSEFRLGHVADSAGLVDGQSVQPGDVIATSGQNVGDSEGAVTLVEWKNPQGQLVNPHQYLDPIFKGTTFAALGLTGDMGLGITKADAELRALGIYDKTFNTVYGAASSLYKQYFGREPTTAALHDIVAHGKDLQQWTDYVRSMPSHIPGIAMGAYTDLRGIVDSASTKLLGHAGSDSVVKELFDSGMTGEAAVNSWYKDHSPNQLGIQAATYNAAYLANAAHTNAIYGDNPHPQTVIDQITAAGVGSGEPPATDQAQTAGGAPLPTAFDPNAGIALTPPPPIADSQANQGTRRQGGPM